MHEIVTLQLGHFSNYLATHFWNAQESYFTYDGEQESLVDHNVHWRPGLGADGSETFLPRTLIYDLKGGFGTLRKTNPLYDAPKGSSAPAHVWNGVAVVHKQPEIAGSSYQKSLDEGLTAPRLAPSDVRFWSDYNRSFFHPKSIVQLYDYELNSSLVPFEGWGVGQELFELIDKEHDLVDRDFRAFAEESDQLQGIQIFTGTDDAWGGFATSYMEHLRDEYGKTCIWTWGVQGSMSGASRAQSLLRLGNVARSLADMSEQASMLVPLSLPRLLPPNVRLDPMSAWHVSGLLGSGLESSALPSRLRSISRSPEDLLGGLTDTLNAAGNQTISKLSLDIPKGQDAASPTSSSVHDVRSTLHQERGFSLSSILEGSKPTRPKMVSSEGKDQAVFGQIRVDRRPIESEAPHLDFRVSEVERRRPGRAATRGYNLFLAVPLPDSFPPIYLDEAGNEVKGHLGMTTILSADASVSDDVKSLRSFVMPFIPSLERESLGNRLAEIVDAYHDGWASGSDSDDD